MTPTARELEAQFFRTLNAFVEPWVRAGVGSPGITHCGLVVVETTGRKSHSPRRTPLVATLVEGRLLVGTVRGTRSQWVRNAMANPQVRYWLNGDERAGTATVIAADAAPMTGELPPLLSHLVNGPLAAAVALGWAFAVITPAVG
jgi:deazaflavin-dependent oxidoreductase (nitroreductase family)